MDMFTINADICPYGTRQSSYLHYGIARTAKARKCIRYLLSNLIDNKSQAILTRWNHTALMDFQFMRKHVLYYASICHTRNCYICNRYIK